MIELFKLVNKKPLWLCVSVVMILGSWSCRKPEAVPAPKADESLLYEPHDRPATVYLRAAEGASGRFVNVPAVIRLSHSRLNQLKQVLLAYVRGSKEGKTRLPVPTGLSLNEVYWTPDNTVVVDVSAPQMKAGYWEETLFVRGLIETVAKNFYEVRQVKLLVDGKDGGTLAGHYALGTADAVASKAVSLAGN